MRAYRFKLRMHNEALSLPGVAVCRFRSHPHLIFRIAEQLLCSRGMTTHIVFISLLSRPQVFYRMLRFFARRDNIGVVSFRACERSTAKRYGGKQGHGKNFPHLDLLLK